MTLPIPRRPVAAIFSVGLPALCLVAVLVGDVPAAPPATAKADAADQGSSSKASPSRTQNPPAASPSASTAPVIPVEVVIVEPSAVTEEVTTTGELRANEQVELRSEVAGRLVGLHFEEGQRVSEGTLLVKIGDADLQADLRRAEVQRELAKRREERSRKLLEESTISQDVYDESKGNLDALDAQADSIRADIAKTEIRAPFTGVIGLRSVSEGSYLTSSVPIARLQSLDPIKLDFSVPEKYAGKIGPGDTVRFGLSGVSGELTGTVYAVEPRIDPATRTVQVRARAPNPAGRLLPGAFAEVKLVLGEETSLTVPAIALIPGLEATTVYIVENGRAVPRQVRVGQRTADRVQVTEGLAAGDRVIVRGVQQVRPGSSVEVENGGAS